MAEVTLQLLLEMGFHVVCLRCRCRDQDGMKYGRVQETQDPMTRGGGNTMEWLFLIGVILERRDWEKEEVKGLQTTNVVNGQIRIILVPK